MIADAAVSALAKLVNQCRPMRVEDLTFNSSLKYLFLHDPAISIDILSPDELEITELAAGTPVANGPAISSARLADFFLGATRVKRQHEATVKLKDAGGASAWTLVSAYYCAYFACLELAKTLGRFSISLDADEIELLKAKATGSHHAAFFLSGHTNFSGREYAGKLLFKASGTRPHVAAWESAQFALRRTLGGRSWPDAQRFLELVDNQNSSPSAIRNTWNYKRSDFYGAAGELRAKEFRKLLGNAEGAYLWMSQRRGVLSDLEPCSIAALCEGLSAPVLYASTRSKEIMRANARSP